ncbi:MAG: hypothetical protein ABIJ39_03355 [Chloroflexota bacterium]
MIANLLIASFQRLLHKGAPQSPENPHPPQPPAGKVLPALIRPDGPARPGTTAEGKPLSGFVL